VSQIIFDIETGPLREDQIAVMMPPLEAEAPPEKLPPFDQAAVKLGNTKDPAKIQEKILDAKGKHEAAWKAARAKYVAAAAEHEAKFRERAALSPLTGQVLAIGYRTDQGDTIHGASEQELLVQFWNVFMSSAKNKRRMIGHNIFGFDLPFLIRRTWRHGMPVPESVQTKGRYWHEVFVDTMDVWRCGNYRDSFVSLNDLAKFFGVGGKPEGVDGGDFARLWLNESTKPQAIEYLKNDLEMTYRVAVAMGIS